MLEHSNEAETQTTYECFNCGELVTHGASPGTCPECGGEFRNRSLQLV
ncbi:MAG: rubrerythrin-like domain-containing protein [archaeon]